MLEPEENTDVAATGEADDGETDDDDDAIGVEELIEVDASEDIDLESLASEELPDSPASESAAR